MYQDVLLRMFQRCDTRNAYVWQRYLHLNVSYGCFCARRLRMLVAFGALVSRLQRLPKRCGHWRGEAGCSTVRGTAQYIAYNTCQLSFARSPVHGAHT